MSHPDSFSVTYGPQLPQREPVGVVENGVGVYYTGPPRSELGRHVARLLGPPLRAISIHSWRLPVAPWWRCEFRCRGVPSWLLAITRATGMRYRLVDRGRGRLAVEFWALRRWWPWLWRRRGERSRVSDTAGWVNLEFTVPEYR